MPLYVLHVSDNLIFYTSHEEHDDLQDERRNAKETQDRPYCPVLISIKNHPDCRQAADEMEHYLKCIDSIEH